MILNLFFNTDKKDSLAVSKNSERPVRSIVKSISWRIVGTADTVVVSWIITGKVTLAITIGIVEFMTKMFLYFFHERVWNNIKWGRQ